MRRLRPVDGTLTHRRAARYHMAKCRHGGSPLHADLRAEMTARYNDLKAKTRAVEDAEDDAVDAMAEADAVEIALENVIRDIDADLAKLDRSDSTINAQRTVCPEGFGKEIEPEGDAQIAALPALRVRLAAFQAHPGVAAVIKRLDQAGEALSVALNAELKAEAKVDTAFEEEQAARRAIRVQIESAYGRMRDLYKSRPALAEPFFLNEGSSRTPAEKKAQADKAQADKAQADKAQADKAQADKAQADKAQADKA
jgi:hypothetical protein